MTNLIEFPLEDGTTILVESNVSEPEVGLLDAGRQEQVIARATQTFEQALDRVKPAASAIIQKIRSLHDAPDEVEVEFGLKLSADAGAFVASAGIDANYAVTLKWKKSGS